MRLITALKRPERRDLVLLGAAVALGLALRIAYVLVLRGDPLQGDNVYYDAAGKLAADGKWLWGIAPYGDPHPTIWKTPGYPLFVGAVYALTGGGMTTLEFVQALLSPATIVLTWMLARRLCGDRRVAIAAAFVAAVYPGTWHYQVLPFPEILAVPMVLVILLAGLEREPTVRRAALLGLLTGLTLLVRSNAFVFPGAVLLAWLIVHGPRRALAPAAVCVAVAALCLVPWTVRNHDLSGGRIIPFSVQDGAISGVFNADAAGDEDLPYAWRPVPARDRDIFATPRSDWVLLDDLRERALDYIGAHPESVPLSVFWNGKRLWDLRPPREVTQDITFEGGRRAVTAVGLGLYWLMLPFALWGLWRLRGRRELLVIVVASVLGATLLAAAASGTRYRAPFEPLIVVLACSAVLGRGRLARQ